MGVGVRGKDAYGEIKIKNLNSQFFDLKDAATNNNKNLHEIAIT